MLQQREKKHDKDVAIRQVYEILFLGGIDIFNRLILDINYMSFMGATELCNLRDYTNECFKDVCKRFSCTFDITINKTFEPKKIYHTKKKAKEVVK
jgi:hypothetical protein